MSIGLKRGKVAVENHKIEWETSAKIIIDLLKNIMKNDRCEFNTYKTNTKNSREIGCFFV